MVRHLLHASFWSLLVWNSMLNTTESDDICADIHLDWIFLAFTIFLFLVAILALLGNVFIFCVLHQTRSLHPNVRLLLKNFALCAALVSLYVVGKSIYNLYIWLNGFLVVYRVNCGLIECQLLLILISMMLSIAAIGADRVINTIWQNRHADIDQPSSIAYLMLASCWLGSVLVVIPVAAIGYHDTSSIDYVCYCEGAYAAPTAFAYLICPTFVLLELSTVICYLFLYRHSCSTFMDFTINTTQHSLAQRYQMLSNVRTTIHLMPTILVHGLTYFALTTTVAYLGIAKRGHKDSTAAMHHMLFVLCATVSEAATHPFLLIARHEYLQKTALTRFPILKKIWCRNKQREANREISVIQRVNDGGQARRKHGLGVLQPANRVSPTVIEFRMKPEDHENILNCIWETKIEKPKRSM